MIIKLFQNGVKIHEEITTQYSCEQEFYKVERTKINQPYQVDYGRIVYVSTDNGCLALGKNTTLVVEKKKN